MDSARRRSERPGSFKRGPDRERARTDRRPRLTVGGVSVDDHTAARGGGRDVACPRRWPSLRRHRCRPGTLMTPPVQIPASSAVVVVELGDLADLDSRLRLGSLAERHLPHRANLGNATIAFSASEHGVTFDCALDGLGARSERSRPVLRRARLPGSRTAGNMFRVRASDAAGKVGAVASLWTIAAPTATATAAQRLTQGSRAAVARTVAMKSSPVYAIFRCRRGGGRGVGPRPAGHVDAYVSAPGLARLCSGSRSRAEAASRLRSLSGLPA